MVGEGRKGCDLERSVQGLEEDGLETATVSSSHLALSPLILGLPPEPPIGEEYYRTTDASTRRRGGGRGAQSKRQGKIYSKGPRLLLLVSCFMQNEAQITCSWETLPEWRTRERASGQAAHSSVASLEALKKAAGDPHPQAQMSPEQTHLP